MLFHQSWYKVLSWVVKFRFCVILTCLHSYLKVQEQCKELSTRNRSCEMLTFAYFILRVAGSWLLAAFGVKVRISLQKNKSISLTVWCDFKIYCKLLNGTKKKKLVDLYVLKTRCYLDQKKSQYLIGTKVLRIIYSVKVLVKITV